MSRGTYNQERRSSFDQNTAPLPSQIPRIDKIEPSGALCWEIIKEILFCRLCNVTDPIVPGIDDPYYSTLSENKSRRDRIRSADRCV